MENKSMSYVSTDSILEIFTQKLNKKFLMGENYFHINPGDIVLDIGSCTGDMTLYYSWKVGDTGRVYAIEPDRKMNLRRVSQIAKGIPTIHLSNCAISNKTGESELYLSSDTSHHTIKKDFKWSNDIGERNSYPVKTLTLDDYIDYIKVNKVDLIYMNIEGSELDVLEGGKKTLTEMNPKIYIAPHEVAGENLKEKVISKLKEYSYIVKDYYGLIYASKNEEDFNFKRNEICHKCGKEITLQEDMKFDGTCYSCYSTFLQSWMHKILGL